MVRLHLSDACHIGFKKTSGVRLLPKFCCKRAHGLHRSLDEVKSESSRPVLALTLGRSLGFSLGTSGILGEKKVALLWAR